MYIKRETNIIVTDEEREILNKARKILLNFENKCSGADEKFLQDKYDELTSCIEHQTALPTAIDLLTTILGDYDL